MKGTAMGFKLDRAFFRPKGAVPAIDMPELGVEVFYLTEKTAAGERCTVKAFAGKRSKPDIYCRYRSAERAEVAVAEWIASLKGRVAEKAATKKAVAAWSHGLKAGDVFYCSWGYDQTNINYYEIVAVKGKAVEVLELQQQSEDTGYMTGKCVPIPGKYCEFADYESEASKAHKESRGYYLSKVPAPRRMIPQRGYNGEPTLSVYSFASAHLVKPVEVQGVKCFSPKGWTAYA
jgi:hypothetical protein